uniref:Zinc finger CCCH domain-containing protein 14 n=1 Tax=Salarias fasciatus TaxID=181472 RepID=A0A672GN82_SALFA
MEIGTEISKKIRAAIKGKLQELGAYIDEDLPDYIMVMVANKKTSHQMTDDLSLFLGNNTIKFTTWLQGVLEKLRSVAGEPASLRHQLQSDSGAVSKSRMTAGEHSRAEESRLLMVSSSRSDRTEARVSSSAHESRGTVETSSSQLTSTVKPLMETLPSEAVIDIKPEMDDDLIGDDPVDMNNHGRTHGASSRSAAELYRAGQGKFTSMGSAATSRSAEGSSHSRQPQDSRSRSSRNGSSKSEELSRKRKAPVASSVVRVSRAADEDSDEVEEDDPSYGGRGLSSRVSLPSKPERKPTLPPTKQATRNLILKAISEAQDSITKTTAYTIPQRQTVPVAPRTRLANSEEMTAAIQLVQEHLHSLAPRDPAYTSTSLPPSRTAWKGVRYTLLHRQSGSGGRISGQTPAARSVVFTTHGSSQVCSSLCVRTALFSHLCVCCTSSHLSLLRLSASSKDRVESNSPKFIVTLDGVPSPLGNLADCDMELDHVRPPTKVTEAASHLQSALKILFHPFLPTDDLLDVEMAEDEDEDDVPLKKQKVLERCKFWPVCKSGDECLYHHPTTQCKTFPNCKFGDKCLFVHPNCKYDARCTKPDCPFTHVSRRSAAAPPPRPALQPLQSTSVCRFFPDCMKMDCPFFHPKACRFAAQCKRAGCTFYHPTTAVPPRHALKWTKAQSR